MTAPLVSICVPTYNRDRYLDSLLHSLAEQLTDFPHTFEVFVSDNGSTDSTEAVVARHQGKLPLRYHRHTTNLGSRANYQFLMNQAQGQYLVYVADDDCIVGHRVADIISMMQANPDIGAAYAPWKLLDLVADKDLGQFYHQDRDVLIGQGQQHLLLDNLLRYGIFPEICIARKDVMRAIMPAVHEQAFYAFVHASEITQRSAVLLLKDPYYVSVTNYFADHQRSQAGTNEAEVAWDRYRGGLEFILGRAASCISPMERIGLSLRIQELIAQRMAVAVRLRMNNQRNPVETYYLAYRLKAMGAENQLATPLSVLRVEAALSHFLTDDELNRDVSEVLFLGTFEPAWRQRVEALEQRPIRFVSSANTLGPLSANMLILDCWPEAAPDHPSEAQGARIVRLADLLTKFPV